MTAQPAPDGPAAEGLGDVLAAHRFDYWGDSFGYGCMCRGWQPVIVADGRDAFGMSMRVQHAKHVAAALAPTVAALVKAAEERGRLAAVPDPSETGLAAAEALEAAADDVRFARENWLRAVNERDVRHRVLGVPVADHFEAWLRERAARLRAVLDEQGQA